MNFVATAYGDADFRSDLARRPAAALRRFGHEAPKGVDLPPPKAPLSLAIDDALLFGPAEWRGDRDVASVVERTEVRLLCAGSKPMVLVHGPERGLTAVGAWARARGMAAMLSPFQFVPEVDAALGYSNRAVALAPAVVGSGLWRGLLISPDGKAIELAWLGLLFGWDALLGRLLGYPQCCCDAFARNWARARRDFRGDPGQMWLADHMGDRPTVDLPWEVNVYARYFGWELIQHFPCRPRCEATHAIARRSLSALKLYWPDAAGALLAELSAPILLHTGGIGQFPGASLASDGNVLRLRFAPDRARFVGAMPACGAGAGPAEATLESGQWRFGGQDWGGRLLTFGRGKVAQEGRHHALLQPTGA